MHLNKFVLYKFEEKHDEYNLKELQPSQWVGFNYVKGNG